MMRNPWLDIPLGDYEAHMAQPAIGARRCDAAEDCLIPLLWPRSAVSHRAGNTAASQCWQRQPRPTTAWWDSAWP